jgi:hypothetical protein
MSGLASQFLSAEADKQYTRSKCLRHMNLQAVIVIAICPSRLGRSCVLTDRISMRPVGGTSYLLVEPPKQQKELSVSNLMINEPTDRAVTSVTVRVIGSQAAHHQTLKNLMSVCGPSSSEC